MNSRLVLVICDCLVLGDWLVFWLLVIIVAWDNRGSVDGADDGECEE